MRFAVPTAVFAILSGCVVSEVPADTDPATSAGTPGGGPGDPSQGSSGAPAWSPLPLTTSYQSWSPYYPMDRNQGRGGRWVKFWVEGGETQELLGQFTWQFPSANDGTGTNRPNATMPAAYGIAGMYPAHPVEYFMNINCNAAGYCDRPDRYSEIISENTGSTFLELWGAGGGGGFVAYLDDQALPGGCTLGNAQAMMQAINAGGGAEYRKPLAFPLPAQPGTAALGSLACEVLLASYTTPVRARLALVVTENRLESSDTNVDLAGNPWRILFARNIYYIEKTGDGGCAPNAPDVVASVPLGGGATRDVAFCAQNYEVYAMRSIPADHRGHNGFGSWNNSVDSACTSVTDCPGGNVASWDRHWRNNEAWPAFYQSCSLDASGLSCALMAYPPGS